MKKLRILLIIILIIVSGCSKENDTVKSIEPEWQIGGRNVYGIFPTKEGFYYLKDFYWLSFFDVASEQSLVLCNKNGCRHDTENCFAYVGIEEKLYTRDGELFIVSMEGEVSLLEMNNMKRKVLLTVADELQNDNCIVVVWDVLISGDILYVKAFVTDYQPEAEFVESERIFAVNLLSKEEKEVISVDSKKQGLELVSAKGNILYYALDDNNTSEEYEGLGEKEQIAYNKQAEKATHTELYRTNIGKKERELVKTVDNGILLTANDEIGIYYSEFNGNGYMYSSRLFHMDYQNGNEKIIMEATSDEGLALGPVVSPDLLEISENGKWSLYQLENFSEEPFPVEIVGEYGSVFSKVQGGYVVLKQIKNEEYGLFYMNEKDKKNNLVLIR